MTKNKYIFMWSSVPTLPNYWGTPEIFSKGTSVFPSADIFQYFDGKIISTYITLDDLNRYRQQESPKFLNPTYFKNYRSEYLKKRTRWWNFIRHIEKKDYVKADLSELKKDFHWFMEFMVESISYFGSTRTEFTFAAEQRHCKKDKMKMAEKPILKNYEGRAKSLYRNALLN